MADVDVDYLNVEIVEIVASAASFHAWDFALQANYPLKKLKMELARFASLVTRTPGSFSSSFWSQGLMQARLMVLAAQNPSCQCWEYCLVASSAAGVEIVLAFEIMVHSTVGN